MTNVVAIVILAEVQLNAVLDKLYNSQGVIAMVISRFVVKEEHPTIMSA